MPFCCWTQQSGSSIYSYDAEKAKQLWELTERIVQFREEDITDILATILERPQPLEMVKDNKEKKAKEKEEGDETIEGEEDEAEANDGEYYPTPPNLCCRILPYCSDVPCFWCWC